MATATKSQTATKTVSLTNPYVVTGTQQVSDGSKPVTITKAHLSQPVSESESYEISGPLVTVREVRSHLDIEDYELLKDGIEVFGKGNRYVELTFDYSNVTRKYLNLYLKNTLEYRYYVDEFDSLRELAKKIKSKDNWAAFSKANADPTNLEPFEKTKANGYQNRARIEVVDESLIDQLVKSATDNLETYCRRKFIYDSYTEYHDGDDCEWLSLKQYPVHDVTEIAIDRFTLDVDDYELYADEGLIWYDPEFTDGNRNVKVVYTAGYKPEDIPEDLKEICLQMVSFLWGRTGQTIGNNVASNKVKIGQFTEWARDNLPEDLTLRLNHYKKFPIK